MKNPFDSEKEIAEAEKSKKYNSDDIFKNRKTEENKIQ